MANSNKTFMERVATFIIDRRSVIIVVFIAAAIFCAFSRNWVDVEDDLTVYLASDTETRKGLDIMNNEFVTYGTADIVIENITMTQAKEMVASLEKIKGVKSIEFDETSKHYNNASALFSITFDGVDTDEISISALEDIEVMFSAYDMYVSTNVGNPLKAIIDNEMMMVDLIAVAIIVLVLLFTSKTYGEIPVLLITFGAAALLNMGTNFMMGTISFVTDSIAIVMQLALGIDYAIILCHRYMDEHKKRTAREAAIKALSKAIPEISASSLTTIAGLLALTFMDYKLGYDIGVVLIKAILLSLCSVFLLMPGLLVIFSRLIDKTHHTNFVPKISFLGRFAYATRYIMPFFFVIVLFFACLFSSKVTYVYDQYSVDSIRHNDTQIAKQKIEELFGRYNTMAIIVPSGEYEKEKQLSEEIEQLPQTISVTGLANTEALDGYYLTSKLTPRQFAELTDLDYEVAKLIYAAYAIEKGGLGQAANIDNYEVALIDVFDYVCSERNSIDINLPDETEENLDDMEKQLEDGKLQLMSDDWTRIVLKVDTDKETAEAMEYLSVVHGIVARYYASYYVVGDTTSCSDLKASFEHDNMLISILTILFVIAVLLFSFKSGGLPVLLILCIQGSIWINFSLPFIREINVFFLTYLIISAIQMGANIDYAIVISSRYMELKEKMPLKEAIVETLNQAFPTIITSGTMLASAGVVIGLLTSNETISAIGVYLGTGTSISIILVMTVLPQILLFGDILIEKTSFDIGKGSITTSKNGIVRLNGHVRGKLDGYIDAEIHGIFKGDISAIIDMGNFSEEEIPELEEGDDI